MPVQCYNYYYVVGKREFNAKRIYKPWKTKWSWEKKKKKKKNTQNTNYKVTAEEQSLAFLLLTIVRWYERITLVCILCVHDRPDTHKYTRTHVFIFLLLLIFAFFYYHAAITLMCLFCVCVMCVHIYFQRSSLQGLIVLAAKMRIYYIYTSINLWGKTFGTFHLRAQTTKPMHLFYHCCFCFFLIRWTEAIFSLIHITDSLILQKFISIRSVFFKLHFLP